MCREFESPSSKFAEYCSFSKIIAYFQFDIFLERLNNSSNETEHSKKNVKRGLTNETKYDIIQE